MHNQRQRRIRFWLQHDRGTVDLESIAPIGHVCRNFVVEDRIECSRAPIVRRHPVVGARQGLHSAAQRLHITRRVAAFPVGLPYETSNESKHIANPMIELGNQQFLATAHLASFS